MFLELIWICSEKVKLFKLFFQLMSKLHYDGKSFFSQVSSVSTDQSAPRGSKQDFHKRWLGGRCSIIPTLCYWSSSVNVRVSWMIERDESMMVWSHRYDDPDRNWKRMKFRHTTFDFRWTIYSVLYFYKMKKVQQWIKTLSSEDLRWNKLDTFGRRMIKVSPYNFVKVISVESVIKCYKFWSLVYYSCISSSSSLPVSLTRWHNHWE